MKKAEEIMGIMLRTI